MIEGSKKEEATESKAFEKKEDSKKVMSPAEKKAARTASLKKLWTPAAKSKPVAKSSSVNY